MKPLTDYRQIERCDVNLNDGDYALALQNEGLQFHYRINRRTQSKFCFVFLPAALPLDKRIVPSFPRWSWGEGMGHNVVSVSDPTLLLSDALLGGWMQGKYNSWAFESISLHLDAFFKANHIDFNRVIFCGSSMGGFLSLQFATCFRGSIGYSENAQTDLRKYNLKKSMAKLAGLSYGKPTLDDVDSQYTHRFSLLDHFEKIGYVPNFYYVIKESDRHHFQEHFLPFLSYVQDKEYHFRHTEVILIDQDRTGHTPLSKIECLKRLTAIVNFIENDSAVLRSTFATSAQ